MVDASNGLVAAHRRSSRPGSLPKRPNHAGPAATGVHPSMAPRHGGDPWRRSGHARRRRRGASRSGLIFTRAVQADLIMKHPARDLDEETRDLMRGTVRPARFLTAEELAKLRCSPTSAATTSTSTTSRARTSPARAGASGSAGYASTTSATPGRRSASMSAPSCVRSRSSSATRRPGSRSPSTATCSPATARRAWTGSARRWLGRGRSDPDPAQLGTTPSSFEAAYDPMINSVSRGRSS